MNSFLFHSAQLFSPFNFLPGASISLVPSRVGSQGIHNLFIVLPQFISSGITSIIFALFDPTKSVRHGHNPGIGLPGDGTVPAGTSDSRNETLLSRSSILLLSRDEVEGGDRGANSVAIVFRYVISCFTVMPPLAFISARLKINYFLHQQASKRRDSCGVHTVLETCA